MRRLSELFFLDKKFFNLQHFSEYKIINKWSHIIKEQNALIDYLKIKKDKMLVQLISVNKILRKMVFDSNADGWINFALINNDDDIEPDYKCICNNKWPMVEWKEEYTK